MQHKGAQGSHHTEPETGRMMDTMDQSPPLFNPSLGVKGSLRNVEFQMEDFFTQWCGRLQPIDEGIVDTNTTNEGMEGTNHQMNK